MSELLIYDIINLTGYAHKIIRFTKILILYISYILLIHPINIHYMAY
jgi:hypothetical protein